MNSTCDHLEPGPARMFANLRSIGNPIIIRTSEPVSHLRKGETQWIVPLCRMVYMTSTPQSFTVLVMRYVVNGFWLSKCTPWGLILAYSAAQLDSTGKRHFSHGYSSSRISIMSRPNA